MEKTSNKPRMTCGTWIVLGVFAVLGIFAVMMINFASGVQENRQEQVQRFFDRLSDDEFDVAFDMLTSDWQARLENPERLAQSFEGIHVTNTTFGFEMGSCWTNTTVVSGERRPTADSQQFMFASGTAQVNDEASEIDVTMTSEDDHFKIAAIYLGDEGYGIDPPEDCVRTN